MFVRLQSFALSGIDAVPVSVEVDLSNGIPAFTIVGLPDTAVRESTERVRAALKNGGWTFPTQRITVNLAPAHTRKGGAGFDLAIALGILAASGQFDPKALEPYAFTGELALDGAIRPVRGVLAMALAARSGLFVVPAENGAEAALAGGRVYAAAHVAELVRHLMGVEPLNPVSPSQLQPAPEWSDPDLADVRGQAVARRALEVAAAGGHNLFMVGPPGAGKSLLSRCLPGILPALAGDEAVEVTRIHSVAGLLGEARLLDRRPFRAPHHSASRSALLGGGSPIRPGELTLAHRGVLFLDEIPEFGRDVLESLRQPLEEGRVLLSRAQGRTVFPAQPMVVAAANPCPCGYFGDNRQPCTCPQAIVTLYRSRLSGPLLDRFDLQIFLAPVPFDDLVGSGPHAAVESSRTVRLRVVQARLVQSKRLAGTGADCNAHMSPQQTRRFCGLPSRGENLMRRAMEQLGLTLRAYDRILKVARTIADLAGNERIEVSHLAEALQYRSLERHARAGNQLARLV